MKILLALLLLIPSLSWGEEITLLCEYISKISQASSDNPYIDKNPSGDEVFIFDPENKTITWLDNRKKVFKLIRELDKYYDFRWEDNNSGELREEIGLNRYNLEIALVSFKKNRADKLNKLECSKKERVL